tara:strand:- start:591 stop:848 length:258 start_codon:yes stop_codon:yes gene_type:complete
MQNELITFLKPDAIEIVNKNYEYFRSMIDCAIIGKINLTESGIKMSELQEYRNLLREQLKLINKIDEPTIEIPKHLFDRVNKFNL